MNEQLGLLALLWSTEAASFLTPAARRHKEAFDEEQVVFGSNHLVYPDAFGPFPERQVVKQSSWPH
jgi:hypothetical protein